MKNKQSKFIILVHVLLILFIMGSIYMLAVLKISFIYYLYLSLFDIFTISIVYALGDARTRLCDLEIALLEKIL